MTSPLITPADLAATQDQVTILDVRFRMGGPGGWGEYAAGHVRGAAYVDLDTELAGPHGTPVGVGGRHPLPSPADFQSAMRRAGVRSDRPVVVYDDWSGQAAGRAWWLLRHHGHPDVRVLDGGWSAWLADGGEVETGGTTPVVGDFLAGPGVLPIVSADEVLDVSVLIDARAGERYRGEFEPVDRVAGHVPGAINVPTSANLGPDGRFPSPAELRTLYADAGVPIDGLTDEARIAVYCGSGVTATHDLLALEIIGVPAALYPGSWSEWVSDPSRPVQQG